jgi:hypothetical protein
MNGHDYEMVAEQVSSLNAKVADLLERMAEVEKVNARLESAALITAAPCRRFHATGTQCMRRCAAQKKGLAR